MGGRAMFQEEENFHFFFVLASLFTTITRFALAHRIHFFFCFLWQNNTLGIHIRWFIYVTWLCCSYFTFSSVALSSILFIGKRVWGIRKKQRQTTRVSVALFFFCLF